jgi:ectoine hydroxylase-related dioxygenase (phytanoyl-CoA dioxygenase family)
MNSVEQEKLDRVGFVILENFIAPDFLQALRTRTDELLAEEGEAAGSEFKQEPHAHRLANLVDKGEEFQRAIVMPRILELTGHVLGPNFKLGSVNFRAADPHSPSPQPLHVDVGALPDERGFSVCNTVWMLDDFTPENGATRCVPGTHRSGKLPQQVLDDPSAPHPDEILVTGKAGTVVVMNAHMWHGGTANRTDFPRRALHVFYTRWDKPQQQYQKKLLRPEVQARLSPQLRKILALDDPLNDKLCQETTSMSGFMR